jgi:hypothetical protein
MVLQQLQSLLGRLYDVPTDLAVADFLLNDNQAQARGLSGSDEQVLVREDEGLEIGVYIAGPVLQRLMRNSPLRTLSDSNIADYCTALEGVSHFQYLTWRAACCDSVSLLELELQAEVDKYAAAIRLLTAQQGGHFPHALHERLFHQVRYCHGLDAASLARYREANRCAARYCRRLDQRYLRGCARPERWLAELRRFYRLGYSQKLHCAAD